MNFTSYLNIADITLAIYAGIPIEHEVGFEFFTLENKPEHIDVNIECSLVDELPEIHGKKVFEGANEDQINYRVYTPIELENEYADCKYIFEIFNQDRKGELQQIAYVDHSLKNWEICLKNGAKSINPLQFPMGPILYTYICQAFNAIMIHASCIDDKGTGRIFSGFSGAGKSTMAGIWEQEGRMIINDDRLIIRKKENAFVVFNTPMYYEDIIKSVELKSVYLIRHSPLNEIRKLSGAMALTRMLAFCIQNNFDKDMVRVNLEFMSQLISNIGIYDLGVVPTKEIIPFILSNS